MINVREGCFETNSSSTHNMVVVEDSQLEKWKNGDLFYVENSNDFVGKYDRDNKIKEIYGSLVMEYANDQDFAEEIADAIKEHRLEDYVKTMIDEGVWYLDTYDLPMSFEEWERHWENRELEGDETTYTTPKGEKIHIYCQYGYDG